MEYNVKRTVTDLSVDELLELYETTNNTAARDELRVEIKRRMANSLGWRQVAQGPIGDSYRVHDADPAPLYDAKLRCID